MREEKEETSTVLHTQTMMQPFQSSSRHFALEESHQSPQQLLPLAFLGNISEDHKESSAPPLEAWQQRCRYLFKIIAICLLLFATTNGVLATFAVADEEVIVGDDGDGDNSSSPTPSLTLSLFLDDANAKEIISFVDRLQDIAATAGGDTVHGHRMLRRGSGSGSLIKTEIITPGDLVTGKEWLDDSEEPRTLYARKPVRDDSSRLAPITTSKGLPWGLWVRQRFFALSSENNEEEKTEENPDQNRRRASSATVNTAFLDSEKALLTLLEDDICDEIEKAFPRAFPKSSQRKCRLQYSDSYAARTTGTDTGLIKTDEIGRTTILLGNDRDEHGCIASAGYSWCESLNQCHRPWETRCDDNGDEPEGLAVDIASEDHFAVLGNDRDEYGCNRSAGFTWCDVSKSCHRTWETPCGDSVTGTGDAQHFTVLGNDRDEYGCNRSAGFTWCEVSKSCHRIWETQCGDDVTNNGMKNRVQVA